MGKKTPRLVGRTIDGRPVFSGVDIFRMMDSRGMDLTGELVFDVEQFVRAAKDSGNYTGWKVYLKLKKDSELFNWKLRMMIRMVYR